MKKPKTKKKVFECKDGCKKGYLDMIVLSCHDCIKHTAIHLTDEQKNKIVEIITPSK